MTTLVLDESIGTGRIEALLYADEPDVRSQALLNVDDIEHKASLTLL